MQGVNKWKIKSGDSENQSLLSFNAWQYLAYVQSLKETFKCKIMGAPEKSGRVRKYEWGPWDLFISKLTHLKLPYSYCLALYSILLASNQGFILCPSPYYLGTSFIWDFQKTSQRLSGLCYTKFWQYFTVGSTVTHKVTCLMQQRDQWQS